MLKNWTKEEKKELFDTIANNKDYKDNFIKIRLEDHPKEYEYYEAELFDEFLHQDWDNDVQDLVDNLFATYEYMDFIESKNVDILFIAPEFKELKSSQLFIEAAKEFDDYINMEIITYDDVSEEDLQDFAFEVAKFTTKRNDKILSAISNCMIRNFNETVDELTEVINIGSCYLDSDGISHYISADLYLDEYVVAITTDDDDWDIIHLKDTNDLLDYMEDFDFSNVAYSVIFDIR